MGLSISPDRNNMATSKISLEHQLEHQLATKKGQIACCAICLTCYINVNIAVVGTRSPKKAQAVIILPLALHCCSLSMRTATHRKTRPDI